MAEALQKWPLALVVVLAIGGAVAFTADGTSAGPNFDDGVLAEADFSPEIPEDCREVGPGDDLQAQIDAAEPGAALCLQPGRYEGKILIQKPLTLHGPRGAELVSQGRGSTIFISSDDVRLQGFTIAGSGDSYVEQDAGIFVDESDDVSIIGVALRDVLFGITAQQVDRLSVEHTEISCRKRENIGMRGDGIRLWETRRSVIRHNRLQHCRDLVVWYSPENLIERNRVEGGRYGVHFMYSSRNVVRHNEFVSNVVGIFVMYSRNLSITSNLLADSGGAAGVGIGLKESGNLEITGNAFIGNTTGTYIDNTPLDRGDRVLFSHNAFRLGDTAVTFHSSPERTLFVANTLKDNATLMTVEGRGDATKIKWRHNYYGQYAGYDMDGDGLGDIPFEHRSATEQLLGRYPKLAVLRGTPTMFLVEAAARVAPLYQPKLLLRDEAPLMERPESSSAAPSLEEVLDSHGLVEVRESDGRVRVQLKGEESSQDSQRY